jgi:hypothetical protein
MVPRAPPVITPPPVFRPDCETLFRLASTPSKPLDLDACPTLTSFHRFCGITDKQKPTWFSGPNQEIVVVILWPKSANQRCRFCGPSRETLHHLGFEAQPRNPPPVLRPNQEKPLPPVLRPNWRKLSPLVLRPNQRKLSQQVLRPNHSQNVDLGFEAQPRNPQSSSPHARCRPHMAPPYLSTARPSSTQHVRPSPVLCTRSPTPATVLVAACYAAPATCTPRDKQMRFFK